jgi:hypothetical protein
MVAHFAIAMPPESLECCAILVGLLRKFRMVAKYSRR